MDAPPQPTASSATTRRPKTINGLRGFIVLSSAEASGAAKVTPRRELSSIHLTHLKLTAAQRASIDALYDRNQGFHQQFNVGSKPHQDAAAVLLKSHRLDLASLESIGNKWMVRWSQTSGQGERGITRALYQWCVLILPLFCSL